MVVMVAVVVVVVVVVVVFVVVVVVVVVVHTYIKRQRTVDVHRARQRPRYVRHIGPTTTTRYYYWQH